MAASFSGAALVTLTGYGREGKRARFVTLAGSESVRTNNRTPRPRSPSERQLSTLNRPSCPRRRIVEFYRGAVIRTTRIQQLSCREQVKLAGLGDTSCGRSFALCPPEERCLRRTFPGGTVRTISRSRPATRVRDARRGCQGWPRRRRGHRVAARSVLDSPEHGASLTAGRAGGLSLAALHARFTDWNAFAVVAAEATPAMENRQPASGILVHFHRRLHEVRTQRALRDL